MRAFEAFSAAAGARGFPQQRISTPDNEVIENYDPHYHMALCLAEMHRPKMALAQLKIAQQANVTPHEKLLAVWAKIQEEGPRKGKPAPPEMLAAASNQAPTPAPVPETSPAPTPVPATGRLKVDSDPPGARVLIDGVEPGVTPFGPVELPAGERSVRLEAPGFSAAEERVTIRPGELETLLVPLVRQPAPAAATPRPMAAATKAPQARVSKPVAPVSAGTFAATALANVAPPSPASSAAVTAATPAPPTAVLQRRPSAPSLPYLAAAIAILIAAAIGGALWLGGRRRAQPEAPTGPTMVLEQALTLADSGTKLGRYELEGVLGRGGMATTYRARRSGDGTTVALKVPHEGCLADQTFVARFLREGQLGEQLHHPRIVRIHDSGEANGRPYLAMELISGQTLKRTLREGGAMPLGRALLIARDIAEALDYAHAKGVVHRDLKPENVMLLPDGTLKVMDFGIARLTDQPGLTTSNIFLGTPLYAAPESVDPKRIDHRVDLYALGIVLFEMLEGTVPFVADSPYRVLEMHMHQPLPAQEELTRPIPTPVWRVVARLCEKDPAARYPSAAALLVEMNRLLQRLDELERAEPS